MLPISCEGWPRESLHCSDSLFAALHQLNQISEEHIPVALAETVHIIGDLGAGGSSECGMLELKMLGTKFRVQDVGCWVRAAGCRVPHLACIVVDDEA